MSKPENQTIREKWRECFDECIHPDMNIAQIRGIEGIFYNGVASVLKIMMNSKDAAHLIEADIVHHLLNELQKTNEQFKKGRDND